MQKLSFSDPIAKTLTPQMCDSIRRRIETDIEAYCLQRFTGEHRTHLGASVIGEECPRMIWYAFRWVKFQIFEGRMLRLFNRGHREEAVIIEMLRGIGMRVWEVDPNTGKQFRIWGAQGHYGGSSDAVGQLPYPELIGLNLLLEFKTHHTGSFKHVKDKGVIVGKPKHYAQMCAYGVAFGFQYGMYVAVNKNDDNLHIEIVKLDPSFADDLVKRAEDIITSPIPPPKISLQPSFFACNYCAFRGICHYNEPVEKNCRSCRYASPIQDAQWRCNLHNATIPADYIPRGCDQHVSIV